MRALRTVLKILASLGISLIVLGLLWRLVGADTQIPAIARAFKNTAPMAIAVYLLMALLQAYLRALRYRILIAVDPHTDTPGIGHIFLVAIARNMMVDMLPARLGELSYVAMLNRGYRVPGALCVSSLSVSFVYDFIALVFVILGLVVWQMLSGEILSQVVYLLIMIAIIVSIMVMLLFGGVRPCTRIAERMLGRLADTRVLAAVLKFMHQLADDIDVTRRAGVLPPVLLLSLGVRCVKYASLFVLFGAVTRAAFPELSSATPLQMLFALVGGEAGSSLAIPTFMGFGAYEAGSTFALTLFGFPAAMATAAMLVVHIWSQCVDYALGGLAFVTFTLVAPGQGNAERPARMNKNVVLFIAAGALLLAGLGVLGLQVRTTKKGGATAPPPPGETVKMSAQDKQERGSLTRSIRGFIVWSSNRSGNHDIYRLTFPGLELSQLTSHPHVEYYARVSPDGRRVVFARSQEPWVSQRNEYPWDVYMLDLETREETLVARNGNVPTWSADGGSVFFQRNAITVVEHRLDSGEEKVRFSAEAASLPANTHLQTPTVNSANNTLAVTLRKGKRATVTIDKDGKVRKVAGGCQLNWGPDDAYLYYVDHGGHMKNQVYKINPSSFERQAWLDLPGNYSHEYFPRVSPDGTHLVLGACAQGHEHDSADYEIFLWKIGTSADQAARLTFHAGNDCWPDVWLE